MFCTLKDGLLQGICYTTDYQVVTSKNMTHSILHIKQYSTNFGKMAKFPIS